MKKEVVINVQGISKKYSIVSGYQATNLQEKIAELIKHPLRLVTSRKTKKSTFWALKDINFSVNKGDVLGIVGRNGAGKSTFLKIISRITDPTTGQIELKGRVASLLEVGTGFNQELSGRENIYLNGAILGMTKKEINSKIEEIIDFSGVREFIDTPVKRYSSGMYVRLAFSVAAYLDSDILLLDEVLAVGDAEFQNQCLRKMTQLAQSGKTLIFVSHNLQAIARLCNKAILIEHGSIQYQGTPQEVINRYLGGENISLNQSLKNRKDRTGNQKILIEKISVKGNHKNKYPNVNDDIYIQLKLHNLYKQKKQIRVSLSIRTPDQFPLISMDSKIINYTADILGNDFLDLECNLIDSKLSPGEYDINAAVYEAGDGIVEDWIVRAIRIKILPNTKLSSHIDDQFPIIGNFTWKKL